MQVARRGDDTMIAVTLDGVAPDVWYDDNRALLDFAFERKAARRDSPIELGAEVVRYLDPDAAVIAPACPLELLHCPRPGPRSFRLRGRVGSRKRTTNRGVLHGDC
jgi:hypothetical protein